MYRPRGNLWNTTRYTARGNLSLEESKYNEVIHLGIYRSTGNLLLLGIQLEVMFH